MADAAAALTPAATEKGACSDDRNLVAGLATVVVIDDEPGDGLLIRARLREVSPDIRVVLGETLEEGIAHVHAERPDLVFCDLSLPDSHGVETIHRLVAASGDLPVIAVSGQQSLELAVAVMKAGAQDYLVKNEITATALLRAMTHAVAAKRLKTLEDRARFVIENAAEGFCVLARDGGIVEVNEAFTAMAGGDEGRLPAGAALLDLVDPADAPAMRRILDATVAAGAGSGAVRLRRAAGAAIEVEVSAYFRPENGGEILGVFRDVTERKAMERTLERLASTDPLTGATNRRRFLEALEAEIRRAVRHGHPLSVAMMDIDHFKRLNDGYGHAAGDAGLVHFTELVRRRLRQTDLLGRLGGEEFAVLLPETPPADAVAVAEDLRRRCAESALEHDGQRLRFTVSVGVAGFAGGGGGGGGGAAPTPHALLAEADQALYRSKQEGRDRVTLWSADAAGGAAAG